MPDDLADQCENLLVNVKNSVVEGLTCLGSVTSMSKHDIVQYTKQISTKSELKYLLIRSLSIIAV